MGGYIHYLEPEVEHTEGLLPEDEDPDLVTLDPRANTLCLVLREVSWIPASCHTLNPYPDLI